MVNFDKFEKRVKETYGKQEFPFDEQNWEKAAKMIDASRQGKNRGGIFLLSAVALLCTTGLVYYFGFSDSAGSLKKNGLASKDITANKELVVNPESYGQTSAETTSANENTNETTNSNSSAETNANENSVSKNTSTNLTGTSKNNTSVTLSKTKNSDKTTTETADQNSNNETKTEEKINASATSNSNETKTSNPSKTNSKKSEPVKSNSKTKLPAVLGSNSNSQNPAKPIPTTPPVAGADGNSNKEGEGTPTTDPIKDGAVASSVSSVAVGDPIESILTDSLQSIKQLPVDSFKFPPIPKGDGISYATNVKMEHNHKNFLFMEAGAVYLFGWTGSNGTDAGGFNLAAGLNFQHYFTNNFSAQIGVQYSTIGNITKTTHTISTVNYDLGIEKDITSIKYQKLHYVVAPIKFALNAGKDNIIGIGCNVGYLLNSESKKEKYKTYSNDPKAVKNNLTSTKETGYVQGFNPIDIQVSAFYRRKIYKGLSANAEFIFGLTDTKNNTFFKSNTFERTTGFKLTLCYDLFKK